MTYVGIVERAEESVSAYVPDCVSMERTAGPGPATKENPASDLSRRMTGTVNHPEPPSQRGGL
jgi:hypothetical protein